MCTCCGPCVPAASPCVPAVVVNVNLLVVNVYLLVVKAEAGAGRGDGGRWVRDQVHAKRQLDSCKELIELIVS